MLRAQAGGISQGAHFPLALSTHTAERSGGTRGREDTGQKKRRETGGPILLVELCLAEKWRGLEFQFGAGDGWPLSLSLSAVVGWLGRRKRGALSVSAASIP